METPLLPVVDPFARSWTQRPWPWLLLELCIAVTLFPVRVVVFVCSLVIAVLLVPLLVCYGRCAATGQKEADGCGETDDTVCPLGAGAAYVLCPYRALARSLLWSVGVCWIRVERQEGCARSLPEARVVTANHTLELDPVIMFWLMAPMFVAKADVARMPVFGSAARAAQAIFVDRHDKNSKHRVLNAIGRRARDRRFPTICVFPEGTTTNGRALIRFQKGAFVPGLPVQPAVIQYWSPLVDVEALGAKPSAILLMMVQPYIVVTVTLLPLHCPPESGTNDPDSFAESVRQAMATVKGVPTTRHAYEDFFFRQFAKKKHINVAQNFELKQLTELFRVDVDHLKGLLQQFAALDVDNSGNIDVAELSSAIGLNPNSSDAHDLFLLFDRNGDDIIDFGEFVEAVALLSDNIDGSDWLALVLSLLTKDANGNVSIADIEERVRRARHLAMAHDGVSRQVFQDPKSPTTPLSRKVAHISGLSAALSEAGVARRGHISQEALAEVYRGWGCPGPAGRGAP